MESTVARERSSEIKEATNGDNGNASWTDLFVLAASRPVCVCTVPGSAVLSGTFNCAKIQS